MCRWTEITNQEGLSIEVMLKIGIRLYTDEPGQREEVSRYFASVFDLNDSKLFRCFPSKDFKQRDAASSFAHELDRGRHLPRSTAKLQHGAIHSVAIEYNGKVKLTAFLFGRPSRRNCDV